MGGLAESKAPHPQTQLLPKPGLEPVRIWGGGGLGALKGLLGSPSGGTKTPSVRETGFGGCSQVGDLPANSQREPPETRKKVSMSVSGAGPARHGLRPAAPQPRSPTARAVAPPPPGIFSPRPPLRSPPPSPRRCGGSAGGGGASRAQEPLPTPQPPGLGRPPRASRVRTAPASAGEGLGPAPTGPPTPPCPRPPTSGPGVPGKPAGQERAGSQRGAASRRPPPLAAPTLRDPWFYGWARLGGRGVAATHLKRRHTCLWAGPR